MFDVRALEWRTDAYGKERRALFLYGIYIGCIMHFRAGGPYRAWLMIDDEGERVGADQWETEDEARQALFNAALRIISDFTYKLEPLPVSVSITR